MKKFYSLLALMLIMTSVSYAQTFPCGDGQSLSDCYCLGAGTLVADSEPCSFDSSQEQLVYILVDVNDATVDGDLDDDSVVAASSSGTFTGVPTGDYVMYQLTVGTNDVVSAGDDLATLLTYPNEATGLATVNGPDCDCPDYNNTGNLTDDGGNGVPGATVTIVDSDGNVIGTTTTDENGNFGFDDLDDGDYTIEVDYPAGYSGDDTFDISVTDGGSDPIDGGSTFDSTVCESLLTEASVLCQDGGSYKVVITLDFSGAGATNGFNVTSTHPGGFNGVTYGSFVDGNFANGAGFSYTISSVDYPGCVVELSSNSIDCTTTDVELIRFDAEAIEEGNAVTWVTATETDNNYFTLEYSVDGVNFTPIAQINGSGTTSTGNSYSFLHDSFETAISFYRLSQTDFDGTTKYISDVERVERAAEELSLTNVFPVPTADQLNIEFIAAKAGDAIIEVFDLTGKLVGSSNVAAAKGVNPASIDVTNLATGTYFISVTIGNESATSKFIKN